MARNDAANQIVVIGLGRFGSSLAGELVRRGAEVLAIDSRPTVVQRHADELTHTAVADTTDPESLRQLGVHQFSRAVVAIGTELEASILTTSLLVDFGIPNIWAKATSRQHGRILERVGAHHVVLPEHEMGKTTAHLVMGRMLDYIELEDEHYALAKTRAPAEAMGRPLGDTRVRSKYGVTVVAIKQPGQAFTYATAETVVHEGDILVVAGSSDQVERFAELT
ncbi:TrkA family potassium uptake protein [Saccharopolyspora indica]|uniref:potassium channel family protein n=1 Tax=Saccharopolyspora indica TaxID=1229659 RepID=UPI0022EA4099|nr:TrkA family potassium uptake protein [Saccharopolyspora indica]MDA3649343.1 TrkA family potassium uptake protein [Saccharopolyspora indica]